jgi:hypothetical protein
MVEDLLAESGLGLLASGRPGAWLSSRPDSAALRHRLGRGGKRLGTLRRGAGQAPGSRRRALAADAFQRGQAVAPEDALPVYLRDDIVQREGQ